MLLKAFYDQQKFSPHKIHSSEKKNESFKENIFANQSDVNNENGNRNQLKRDINININNELDNSIAASERNLGNIIINSLDVSIKLPHIECRDRGNDVHISCSQTTPLTGLKSSNNDNQQIVTSSSDENCSLNDEDRNLTFSDDENDATTVTRAVYRNTTTTTVPDDILFDYHNILRSYRSNKFNSNNNFMMKIKHPNRVDDVKDYHMKCTIGDIKPITSAYLSMTRSMGLTDEDALNLVSRIFTDELFAL